MMEQEILPSVRDGFENLTKYLKSRNDRNREYAAKALGVLRDPRAIDALVKALADDSVYVRKAAVESLSALAYGNKNSSIWGRLFKKPPKTDSETIERIVKVLIPMMTDADIDVRTATQKQLSIFDPDWPVGEEARLQIPTFINTLGDNSLKSAPAARVLGLIGDRQAMGPLLSALMNDSYDVRIQAEMALDRIDRGWLAGREIRDKVPEFVAALKHPSESVRKNAAEMMGTLVVRSAHEDVAAALSDTEKVAAAALETLRIIGDERAVLPIVRAVKSGRIDMEKAIEILTKLMKQNQRFKKFHPHIFCSQCHCRGTVIRFKGKTLLSDKVFYVCRKCHMTVNLLTGVKRVAGVIGGEVTSLQKSKTEGTIIVPLWNEQNKTAQFADIDLLLVSQGGVESYQRAINAVILELTGNLSKTEDWLNNIPITIEGKPTLSKGVESMLADYFRWIPGGEASSQSSG